jgi:hypothetical protein
MAFERHDIFILIFGQTSSKVTRTPKKVYMIHFSPSDDLVKFDDLILSDHRGRIPEHR